MNADLLEDYIESHISEQPDYLSEIERTTNLRYVNGRMCSGHLQGRLLKMLTAMINPSRVLELGTFTGFSALCIAEALRPDATVDTIEIDDEMEDVILENLEKSPHWKKVRLHIGDALSIMDGMEKELYDLIFIDADKRHYSEYLLKAVSLLKKEGFIIADNTLWDGHVTDNCRHSSQTKGILEFNDLASSLPDFETVIIPVRDGLTLMRKIK